MFIRIERDSSVPVSRQIADQIRAQCLSGALAAGSRIPSVRQLARDLAVNQNTVLRVYERLTAESLLEVRHGDGTFVSDSMPKWRLKRQRERLAEEWQRLVNEGRMLGLADDELRALMDESLKSSTPASHAEGVTKP
jgi:DNA-binding transcriptional regulator YhcF (GntR family)